MSLKKTKSKTRKNSSMKVPGFRASAVACGIKGGRKKDLALIVCDVPATVAGVFTTNRVKAASVRLDMERVEAGRCRGVIVNSGNANAFTGAGGVRTTKRTATVAEKALGLEEGGMLVSSTGVIGVDLPVEKIEAAMDNLVGGLKGDGFGEVAEAIMTTDTFPKVAFRKVRVGGATVTVGAVAKGAGMMCPNMATMLAYIMTDAKVAKAALRKLLKEVVDTTFNRIIVDNDTSTNDTVLFFSGGGAGGRALTSRSPGFKAFKSAVEEVCKELAFMIVRDGEGATKFIEITVKRGRTMKDATAAARALASSMLVKTAFFGEDPNWGRIICAAGYSGAFFDPAKLGLSINGVTLVSGGRGAPGAEKKAGRVMKARSIRVILDLKAGKYSDTVWTTDLSTEYVKINSEYTT